VIRYFSEVDLNEIVRYHVDLDSLLKLTSYSKSMNHEYADYLRFADQLGYNMKDKRILYPKDIKREHDRLYKMIEINRDKILNKNISKRYKELKCNAYHDNTFVIFPAKSVESLIKESKEQDNCVKTYASKYAAGDSDIYFMRLLANPNKSLVTVEVKNNKVVQQRTKHNDSTTDEQKVFLRKWEKEVLND